MVPVATDEEIGMSIAVISPESAPNTIEPSSRFSIEVIFDVKSYESASVPPLWFFITNPPTAVVVANPPFVLIERIGTADVEVAIVQAYAVEFKMVEVEEIG